MRVLKILKNHALVPGLVFLIALALYRELVLHANTYLLDWFDYPYYAWTLAQNLGHFTHLTVQGFFNTTIFYPFQGSLLFSDLLLPQSAIALLLTVFTKNPIALLNITFLITIFLNTVSSYFLWLQFFRDKSTLFFGTLVTSLSPFFFLQVSHFQMITLWPFFMALGLITTRTMPSLRRSVGTGIFIFIQFFASVYLAVFLLATIATYYALRVITDRSKSIQWLKSAAVVLGIGLVSTAPIAYRYSAVQHAYHVERSAGEYITYAAHPTDYLFTNPYRSWGGELLKSWNRFNQHTVGELAAFPSFALLGAAVFSLVQIRKINNKLSLSIFTDTYSLFFLSLMLIGFVCSLGPRLSVNGSYVSIPLPYFGLLKVVPLLEPIRATMRWSLLFYLGLTYFALKTITRTRFRNQRVVMVGLLSLLYIVEVFPKVPLAHAESYYPSVYQTVAENCQTHPEVLLEYPLDENRVGANVATNLSYKTKIELSSVYHHCNLINGYSGYEPLDYNRFEHELDTSVAERNATTFFKLLDQRNTDMIKLNKQEISSESATIIGNWFNTNHHYHALVNSPEYGVVHRVP